MSENTGSVNALSVRNKRYMKLYSLGVSTFGLGILLSIGAMAWPNAKTLEAGTVGMIFIALGISLLIISKLDQVKSYGGRSI